MTHHNKTSLLFLIIVISCSGMFFISPVAQDPAYHLFADQRTLLGINNFFNVISNLPFFIVGVIAFRAFLNEKGLAFDRSLKFIYITFFTAVILIGAGSGYYHLNPNNQTLFWDRLPMSIAFMSFFALIAGEYISEELAKKIIQPLIMIGIFSVAYWSYTESTGMGDLRLYALVQFLPLLLIFVILIIFPPRYTQTKYYWLLLLCYALAKLFEELDDIVYLYSDQLISGHAIKHLIAATGAWFLLQGLKNRKKHDS